ncbi:farnesol dehydrogenase-like [Chironomus tepperi]|uniref:farnesol dehydrogenase-like n=1 Tax=Chironomus tepperi TaxID=113505 RepID=UPI00391FAB65
MEKWEGKTAIVTGASSGIGNALTHDLVKHGINVVALARRMDRLETLKEQLKNEKGKVIPIKCDVSDKASIDAAFEQIEREVGTVHILVNNAGVAQLKMIFSEDESTEQTIINTINTNLVGLVLVTRKSYRLMRQNGEHGIIINIGSVVGHSSMYSPHSTNVYRSTKHAVRAVSDSMRHELVKLNYLKIRVCEISPGAVETEIFETGGWKVRNSDKSFVKSGIIPMLKSEDVSRTILFMLELPYDVNVTEMIVKPVGEKF